MTSTRSQTFLAGSSLGLGQDPDPVADYVHTMSPEQQEWLYSEMIKRLGSNPIGRNVLALAHKSQLGLGSVGLGQGDFDFGAIIGSIADAASKIGVSLIGAHAAQQANQTAADAAYNAQLAQLAAVKAQSVANSTTAMAISKYLLIGGVAIGGLAMVLMFMRKKK
jgi:hypothetical protein